MSAKNKIMKQRKIIMAIGLPGSGKSTWAKQYQAEHPDTMHINKDELCAMLHYGKHSLGRENFVLQVHDFIVGPTPCRRS
jgi:predicted kinase